MNEKRVIVFIVITIVACVCLRMGYLANQKQYYEISKRNLETLNKTTPEELYAKEKTKILKTIKDYEEKY